MEFFQVLTAFGACTFCFWHLTMLYILINALWICVVHSLFFSFLRENQCQLVYHFFLQIMNARVMSSFVFFRFRHML